jgi:hypothetical protein
MLKFTRIGFLIGVPARDLTDEEAEKYGRERHIKSGLYKEIAPQIPPVAIPASDPEIVPSYRTRKKKLEKNFEEAD